MTKQVSVLPKSEVSAASLEPIANGSSDQISRVRSRVGTKGAGKQPSKPKTVNHAPDKFSSASVHEQPKVLPSGEEAFGYEAAVKIANGPREETPKPPESAVSSLAQGSEKSVVSYGWNEKGEQGDGPEGTAPVSVLREADREEAQTPVGRKSPLIPSNEGLVDLCQGKKAALFSYGSHYGPEVNGLPCRRFYLPVAPWRTSEDGSRVAKGLENTPLGGRQLVFSPGDSPFRAGRAWESIEGQTTISEEDYTRMHYECTMARMNLPLDRDRLAMGAYNAGGTRGLS